MNNRQNLWNIKKCSVLTKIELEIIREFTGRSDERLMKSEEQLVGTKEQRMKTIERFERAEERFEERFQEEEKRWLSQNNETVNTLGIKLATAILLGVKAVINTPIFDGKQGGQILDDILRQLQNVINVQTKKGQQDKI